MCHLRPANFYNLPQRWPRGYAGGMGKGLTVGLLLFAVTLAVPAYSQQPSAKPGSPPAPETEPALPSWTNAVIKRLEKRLPKVTTSTTRAQETAIYELRTAIRLCVVTEAVGKSDQAANALEAFDRCDGSGDDADELHISEQNIRLNLRVWEIDPERVPASGWHGCFDALARHGARLDRGAAFLACNRPLRVSVGKEPLDFGSLDL